MQRQKGFDQPGVFCWKACGFSWPPSWSRDNSERDKSREWGAQCRSKRTRSHIWTAPSAATALGHRGRHLPPTVCVWLGVRGTIGGGEGFVETYLFMHLFNRHFLNVQSMTSAILSPSGTQTALVFKMHDLLQVSHSLLPSLCYLGDYSFRDI